MDELPLFIHWTNFLKWLLNKTEKFPKKVRFTFTSRIDNLAIDVLSEIIEARYNKEKVGNLKRINIYLEKLRIFLRICYEMGYLDTKAYEFSSIKIEEAGNMTGGWLRQQKAK